MKQLIKQKIIRKRPVPGQTYYFEVKDFGSLSLRVIETDVWGASLMEDGVGSGQCCLLDLSDYARARSWEKSLSKSDNLKVAFVVNQRPWTLGYLRRGGPEFEPAKYPIVFHEDVRDRYVDCKQFLAPKPRRINFPIPRYGLISVEYIDEMLSDEEALEGHLYEWS